MFLKHRMCSFEWIILVLLLLLLKWIECITVSIHLCLLFHPPWVNLYDLGIQFYCTKGYLLGHFTQTKPSLLPGHVWTIPWDAVVQVDEGCERNQLSSWSRTCHVINMSQIAEESHGKSILRSLAVSLHEGLDLSRCSHDLSSSRFGCVIKKESHVFGLCYLAWDWLFCDARHLAYFVKWSVCHFI